MGRTEQVELTTLCLLSEGSRILLQNRTKSDWKGYALPGGHMEPGESIVDGVIREMKEETGLTVLDPRLCGIKQFIHDDGHRYLVFLFRASRFAGELTSSEEGKMEWIERSELHRLPTVPDFQELLSVFDREDLTEFLYVARTEGWEVVLK